MIILGTNSIKDTGYNVANSCRFNSADSSYLDRTPGSVTSTRKNTFSFWVKRVSLGAYQYIISTRNGTSTNRDGIAFNDSDQIDIRYNAGSSSPIRLTTTRVFRDPSAFMHIVVAVDTEQSTASNRIKVYINGTQETTFATANYMDEDYDFALNAKTDQTTDIGNDARSDGSYFDGYLAEFVAIDGTQNAVTDFGEYNEDSPTIWQPKDVSGLTFGNAGFYLDFENSAELGTDVSGNSNTFSENNLDATDQATDVPTNNFATLNPLWRSNFDNDGTFSQGNCKRSFTSDNSDRGYGFSTMGVTAGRWYWEIKIPTVARASTGVGDATAIAGFSGVFYDESTSKGMQVGTSGSINENNTSTAYANSLSDNDIVMFALDMDNHRCWYGINGTWQDSGDPTSGSTGTGDMTTQISDQSHINTGEFIFPFCFDASTSGQASFEWNFGGCPAFSISSSNSDGNGYGSFEYAPPSGFLALCSKNLGSDGG